MKKFYSLLAIATMAVNMNAQITVVYSENMGTPTTNPTDIAQNTFQNAAPITYVGTADVRNNSGSTGYTGASAGGNILFNAKADVFTVSGIDTSNANNIKLSFGHTKTTNVSSNELVVSYSTDGTTWKPLTYSRPTGSGSNGWILIETSEELPATANLSIKFDAVNLPTSAQFRIDDLKITQGSLAITDINATKNNLVKNTVVSNEIIFGQAAKVSVVNMTGQVVKTADVSENSKLNVADLSKGMYIVTGMVNGKTVSQKVMKK